MNQLEKELENANDLLAAARQRGEFFVLLYQLYHRKSIMNSQNKQRQTYKEFSNPTKISK